MKTIILFYSYMGKEITKKETDYLYYQEGNEIAFKGREYRINRIIHDEDKNIKYARAYDKSV